MSKRCLLAYAVTAIAEDWFNRQTHAHPVLTDLVLAEVELFDAYHAG